MSHVIRRINDANHAQTDTGEWVHRSREMHLPSHRRVYPVLQTSIHFCFREPGSYQSRPGSTIFCTCGAPAGIFNFDAYRKFTEINNGEVVACVSLMQYGVHADGSHE